MTDREYGPMEAFEAIAPRRLGTGEHDAARGSRAAKGGAWKIVYTDANGVMQEVSLGASGTYVVSNGASSAPSFGSITVALKTQAPGYFQIPADTRGVSVTSGAANTLGSWTEMIATTAAALYIVGVHIDGGSIRYMNVDIGVGAGGSEVSQGVVTCWPGGSTVAAGGSVYLPYPTPVATGVRIAVRTETENIGTVTDLILMCIAQASLVAIT